ncbi:WXG100 family type VII secretion target [Longispora sp. K20-0274]|uniref:WXG100 family type VII secretion target n=1 Tax=Longispora sp. K20-0274 TaxID=3088255 RepID=UPI00399A0017
MAKTEAELQVMEHAAREFESVNAELQGMLSRLLDGLEPLRQKWQGAGVHSFEQVKRAFHDDRAAIDAALRETAAALRTAGHTGAAADLGQASPAERLPL